jgi:polar amino acid transport system substrate-binding protein
MRLPRLLSCTALAVAGALHAEPKLSVHYLPLVTLDARGVPDVPMARRMARWAADAGLDLRWAAVPLKRSLQDLKLDEAPMCVLGLFRTRERLGFARFSRPIEAGEPQVFVANTASAARVRALPDARAVVLDTQLVLLLFDGVSYGDELDTWIAQRSTPALRVAASNPRGFAMLARQRADVMISSPSRLAVLRASGSDDARLLEVVTPPDMPPPPARHLACSYSVPAEVLARLDGAIRAHPPPAHQ